MSDMSNIRHLLREAHACGVNPLMGVPHIPVLLRELKVTGLRDRMLHSRGYTFVQVFVDNREIFKTEINPEPRSPTWSMKPPQVLYVYPSSMIRFSVSRYHRHTLQNELLGEVEGTVWTFFNETQHKVPSQDSPDLSISPLITYDSPVEATARRQMEEVDILEIERHRIEVLHRQHSGKKKNGFVKVILPGVIDAVMDDLDALLTLLDHIAPAIPLSKIVVVLLQTVQKMVKAHGHVEAEIGNFLKTLRETLSCVADCEPDEDLKKQAVKLVGESVTIVDKWVHERSGKQFIKALHTEERIKTFQTQLAEFNRTLSIKRETSTKAKAKPNRAVYANNITTSPTTYESAQLPELLYSEQSSPLDSPALMTPPATHPELAGEKNGPGLISFAIKEVEELYGEFHHAGKHGVGKADEMRGERGIIGNVVVV